MVTIHSRVKMSASVEYDINLKSDPKCLTFSLAINYEHCKTDIQFTSYKDTFDSLKKFCNNIINDIGEDVTVHGEGSGDGYCNLMFEKGSVIIDCDPGHCCSTTISLSPTLLVGMATEILQILN